MIIISALDNSGQLYGADLITSLKRHYPDEQFIGIGGNELEKAGCELIHNISDSSAMLTGVIGALKWAIPAFAKMKKLIKSGNVNLVILIDSPTFNLPLARVAKKYNVKTLYYIAPQTWAWAEFRTKKIKDRIDKLAVILPFEQQYFRAHSIDAEFVGHPFIQTIKNKPIDENLLNKIKSSNPKNKKIIIAPGSRTHVIKELLPAQLRIINAIKTSIPNIDIFLTAWPPAIETIKDIIKSQNFNYEINNITPNSATSNNLTSNNTISNNITSRNITSHNTTSNDAPAKHATSQHNAIKINIFTQNHNAIIKAADLALVASGTSTLEIAFHACPMIIMYNASKILYHLIAKHLIKTPYLSLINILANQQLVPEFMPYIKDENLVAQKAIDMLNNPQQTHQLKLKLKNLIETLETPFNPADKTASLAIELIEKNKKNTKTI